MKSTNSSRPSRDTNFKSQKTRVTESTANYFSKETTVPWDFSEG